jgi:hypothetical protein
MEYQSLTTYLYKQNTEQKNMQNIHVPRTAQNMLAAKILVGAEILNQILLCLIC